MKIAVIGAGAWGSALSHVLSIQNHRVSLWVRRKEQMEILQKTFMNGTYLPGIKLSSSLTFNNSFEGFDAMDYIFIAVPTQSLRELLMTLKNFIDHSIPLILCCKGLEIQNRLLVHEVVEDVGCKNPVVSLSGPNFAQDTASNFPSGTTIAAWDEGLAKEVVDLFKHSCLRPYWTQDLVGVEICGALKNVFAIASGMSSAVGFGDNTRAMLITRGLKEMARFIVLKGGYESTVYSLAGLGDLILTTSSKKSRNFHLGYEIGQGRVLDNLLENRQTVAEGVYTTKALYHMLEDSFCDMPICLSVYEILYKRGCIEDFVKKLMDRPFKKE